ncbi:DUF1735 domain-containing protein [Fibrella sp. HMF5335]|uniref:DUF1735 domain-containing protein n=1 Tax=Fibrella rubiginis TaxID=2817060 RepID=A0A939GK67_9BACT|nr:DUF1735 domain-containing protein [Fibrella rubiginis]MBO0938930.1 DUF1735 domain-containing protein [Fibrella rubiginis]
MNKLFKVVLAASVALSMTSCLKDDEHFVDFAASGYVAEIPYVANRSILKAVTVAAGTTPTVAPVDINIASPNPPTTDVQIGVGPDQAALDAYNKANNRAYKLLPATAYQLSPATVTVASGNRIGTVNVSFIGSQVPTTGGPYALALSIQTVPSNVTISANYRTQILAITVK